MRQPTFLKVAIIFLVIAISGYVMMQGYYMFEQHQRQSQSDAFDQKFRSGKVSDRGRHAEF